MWRRAREGAIDTSVARWSTSGGVRSETCSAAGDLSVQLCDTQARGDRSGMPTSICADGRLRVCTSSREFRRDRCVALEGSERGKAFGITV